MLSKKLVLAWWLALGMTVTAGCNSAPEAAATNTNANATTNENAAAPVSTTRAGADDSQITTTTEGGVRTETRVFRNNPRIAKVVVTTSADGKRTVHAYSPSGEERELNDKDSESVLEKTGDAIADGARFTVDKTKDVAGKTKEGTEKGIEKGKDIAGETAEGTKKVAKKTAEGAKKVGKAVKKVIP